MSFSQNLQNLRKRENMSQETLAGILEVSRQAVSKWESGSAYPETEKIISICKIFNCSMDTIVMGKIPDYDVKNQNDYDLKKEYDSFYNKYSKAMAFSIGLILLGVTAVVGMTTFSNSDTSIYFTGSIYFTVPILFMCVIIAVPVFIIFGLKDAEMKKKMKDVGQIYEQNEVENFKKKYPFAIAGSVALILLGGLAMFLMEGLKVLEDYPVKSVVILLLCVTIAVPIIVYFSLQNDKYDNIEKLLKQDAEKEKRVAKYSGVIMLSATFIFLFLGFVFSLWHIAWVVFPLGGVLCGIVSTIIGEDNE